MVWPNADPPVEDIYQINPRTYVGTLLRGVNVFDFEAGEVTLGNNSRREQMNASLSDFGAEYFESLAIHADNHIEWMIPGEFGAASFQNQFRADHISHVKGKVMLVQAFAPTECFVFAGTEPQAPVDRISPVRSWERVSYSNQTDSVKVPVTDTYSIINMTTEYEAIKTNTQTTPREHVMNLKTLGMVVDNQSSTEPVDINIQVKDTLLEGFEPYNDTRFADLPGWTSSNPQTIPAGESYAFNIAGARFHFVRIRAKATNTGASSSVSVSFLGDT